MLANLMPLDIAALVVLVFFFILGLFKGFTWQVIRLGTIIAGMALAKAFAPEFKGFLERSFTSLQESQYTIYIAYFTIFVGVFIAGTILATLLGRIVKKLKLRTADSLFGGLVGLVTGSAIVVVIVMVLLLIFEEGEVREDIKSSRTFDYAQWVIGKATPLIPPEIREEVLKHWEEEAPAEDLQDDLQQDLRDDWPDDTGVDLSGQPPVPQPPPK